ncbi:hypothetical protein Tco_0567586 [Tanacetum coccineum]
MPMRKQIRMRSLLLCLQQSSILQAKVGPRKSSTNSKEEKFLTELQNLQTQEKEAFSTGISEDTPEILAFRRDLDQLTQKHLREVTTDKATNMPELTIFNKPQKGIFDEASYDEEGMVHDFNNLPTEVAVSPIPTLRIHNIHPQSQILGDPKSSVQTRSRVKQTSGAHALEEPKKISEALKDDSWVEAMQEELLQFRLQQSNKRQMEFSFPQDKYVRTKRKSFDLASVKTAITPMETKMALTKDEEAADVDVTPKTSHLNAVKRIFKYLKGKPNLGLWYPRESTFDLEAFSDSDYAGANLDRKSTTGGCQFL